MNVKFVFFLLCGPWLSVAVEQPKRCLMEDSKSCAADEYFDDNVCSCSSCSDICQSRPDKRADTSCQHSCPEYHKRTSFLRESLTPQKTNFVRTTIALVPEIEDNALVKKPLFWTSVVSVFISVLASIILIVLCTCKKSRSILHLPRIWRTPPSQTRMPAQSANEKSERSTGMLRSAEEASNPLLASDKNFSKDKCGETSVYPVHAITLDSCAIDHETIVSRCQSSYLHKPYVASFENLDFLLSNDTTHVFFVDGNDGRDWIANSRNMNASVNMSTNANAVTCTDISVQKMDSERLGNLEDRSCVEVSEEPLTATERYAIESGCFDLSLDTSITNCEGESPGAYPVYTVPLLRKNATEKEIRRHSSFHAQETHSLKDKRNGATSWNCYVETPPVSFYGSGSKATDNQCSWDSGMKPSALTSPDRIKDSVCNESDLQKSGEETGLKQMQPAMYCILNDMNEHICPASHQECSCDRYIPATGASIHKSEKHGDGKQLSELNLKKRSGADTMKLEPDALNVEVRNFSKCAENNNEEDTTMKTRKLNTEYCPN